MGIMTFLYLGEMMVKKLTILPNDDFGCLRLKIGSHYFFIYVRWCLKNWNLWSEIFNPYLINALKIFAKFSKGYSLFEKKTITPSFHFTKLFQMV